MAGSTRLFLSIQKYYQTLGIYPESNGNVLLNFRNLFAIFCFVQNFFSTLTFFLFKANTTLEHGVTFYAFVSEFFVLLFLFIQMWQMPKSRF